MSKYGVWKPGSNRWAIHNDYREDGYDTPELAQQFIDLILIGKQLFHPGDFEVRERHPDGTPGAAVYRPQASEHSIIPTSSDVGAPTIAINNHTCPSCKNDRCSKSEKTCWKCGGKL